MLSRENSTGRPLADAIWLENHHKAKLPERTAFARRLAELHPNPDFNKEFLISHIYSSLEIYFYSFKFIIYIHFRKLRYIVCKNDILINENIRL